MKKLNPATRIALALTAFVALAYGCMPLQDAINNALGVEVIGTTPSSNFAQNGGINFSMLPNLDRGDGSGEEVKPEEVKVEVLNEDGTYSQCEYVGKEVMEGSAFNSLALLIDDSGSMEREYPESLYPGLCPTCPHDPDRLRGKASEELIKAVLSEAPESRLGLMDFGPSIDSGLLGTRVLMDFTSDPNQLLEALGKIDGSQEAGTPLWDSLADQVGSTTKEADEFEDILQMAGRSDETTGLPISVKRFIVVLSDGDDRDSSTYSLETLIELARTEGVIIHAIGLGPAAAENKDPRLQVEEQISTVQNLQTLAEKTGGFYASVHDPAALEVLYKEVARSLTEGYTQAEYACRPNGEVPKSGQFVTGRITDADGNTTEWTMIAP